MKTADPAELDALKQQVAALRDEVRDLQDFVKALYAMIDSGEEEDDAPEGFSGVPVFGRSNT